MKKNPLLAAIASWMLLVLFTACHSSTSPAAADPATNDGAGSVTSENNTASTRCAHVKYFNPNSGTRSEYTLTVEIKDRKLTVMHFPDGHLDQDHFTPPALDASDKCSFASDRGYQYEVQLLKDNEACNASNARKQQCNGITKAGERCKHMTSDPSGYCHQHRK